MGVCIGVYVERMTGGPQGGHKLEREEGGEAGDCDRGLFNHSPSHASRPNR